LRGYPSVGARQLDDCYYRPRGAMRVRWHDLELTIESSQNCTHAQVYTAPHAVVVEPQTAVADASNLAARGVGDTGVAVVTPGRPLVATTRWTWRAIEGDA
jgi:hypothetical protein